MNKKKRPSASLPGLEGPQRLNKLLAAAGLGSRRHCEQLIVEGRVEVDGVVVDQLGAKADPEVSDIVVDGTSLRKSRAAYYAVHKPVGVLSTNRDPEGRTRIIDLVPNQERLFPVGRLDRSSEGLMLLTNDGELAQRLAHPKYGVSKTYSVVVQGQINQEHLATLRKGVYLSDGLAKVDGIRIRRVHKGSTELEMVLSEGKNREIRRVLARVGHKVVQLKRIAIGTLRLGMLPKGAFRPLSPEEVQALYVATTPGRAKTLGPEWTEDYRPPSPESKSTNARQSRDSTAKRPSRSTTGNAARGDQRSGEPVNDGSPPRRRPSIAGRAGIGGRPSKLPPVTRPTSKVSFGKPPTATAPISKSPIGKGPLASFSAKRIAPPKITPTNLGVGKVLGYDSGSFAQMSDDEAPDFPPKTKKPTGNVTDKPATAGGIRSPRGEGRGTARPAGRTMRGSASPSGRPAGKPAGKSTGKPTGKPSGKPSGKPAGKFSSSGPGKRGAASSPASKPKLNSRSKPSPKPSGKPNSTPNAKRGKRPGGPKR